MGNNKWERGRRIYEITSDVPHDPTECNGVCNQKANPQNGSHWINPMYLKTGMNPTKKIYQQKYHTKLLLKCISVAITVFKSNIFRANSMQRHKFKITSKDIEYRLRDALPSLFGNVPRCLQIAMSKLNTHNCCM